MISEGSFDTEDFLASQEWIRYVKYNQIERFFLFSFYL